MQAVSDRGWWGAPLLVVALAALGCSSADIAEGDGGDPAGDGGAMGDSGPDGVDGGPDGIDAGPDGVDAGPDGVDGGPDGVDAGPDGVDGGPEGVDAGPGVMPGAGDLVISEIMPDSDVVNDDCGEWFEVHNPSADTAYNLVGCLLRDEGNVVAVTTDLVVAPGGYVSLARYQSALCDGMGFTDPGFAEDYSYGPTLKFSNDGDTVTVECDGTTVDEVDYNGWTITKGASLNLDPAMLDASANDSMAAWCNGVTIYNMSGSERDRGTPGMPNTDC